MKTSTVIAQTTRGHRVFLESVGRIGQRFNVEFSHAHITVRFTDTGKRKVVASKGGVIDLESKKVSAWKGAATHAEIEDNEDTIVIRRAIL